MSFRLEYFILFDSLIDYNMKMSYHDMDMT